MNNKKAIEMSLNTVIVIVIGLLLLLILAFLLTNGFKNFGTGTSCDNKLDHSCIEGNKCNTEYPIPAGWSCGEGKICCSKNPLSNS